VVGCGNSPFSYDLYDKGGYTNITSIDYSENVIAAMRMKYPRLQWVCADMTKLNDGDMFPADYFSCVIDKAAMDALMSDEGDVWNPSVVVVESCWDMCRGISDVLKGEGYFLQISFAQPHFRVKYLSGKHKKDLKERGEGGCLVGEELDWGDDVRYESIFGDESCFGHFLYIMKKDGGG